MSTDLGRLTPYPGRTLLGNSLWETLVNPYRATSCSVRSLRIQSHPLTRLLRDSVMPTAQFLIIFSIGLTFALSIPKSAPDLQLPAAPSPSTVSK